MTAQCAHCGTETDHPEFFFNEQRSYQTGIQKVCPSCWERRSSKENWQWLVIRCVILLLVAGLVIFRPDFKPGWVLLNLELLFAALYASIIPHELGHLVAAKLLGLRVFRMVFGRGRVLLSWKILGVPTELRAWPTSGFVQGGYLTKNWFRLRNAVFAGAGPLANASIAVSIWKLGDYGNLDHFPNLHGELHPVAMFFAANVLMACLSFVPRKVGTHLGKVPSDGSQILMAPFLKSSQIDETLEGTQVLEAHALAVQKRFDEATAVIEAGLQRFPKSLGLILLHGSIALEKRELDTARERFLSALGQLPEGHSWQPLLYNNIAYTNALLARPEFANEADEYSAAALKAMSWIPGFQGTRGSVLVQYGKLEEGRRLLEASTAAAEEPDRKAENLCWIAVAAVRQGHFEEAEKLLNQAHALGGETLSLKWAQAAVSAREFQSPWSP